MENINIKVILDEVFGKSWNTSNNIACDTCKYKEDCNLLNKFINDIKDKDLSPDQYVRGLALFIYVLKEQKYINDFDKTQEDIIKLVTQDGFELDWLINRWDSIIEDKDILKPIIAPPHAPAPPIVKKENICSRSGAARQSWQRKIPPYSSRNPFPINSANIRSMTPPDTIYVRSWRYICSTGVCSV